MSYRKKATDDQLREAYGRLGNIWKVAAEFGMCGQSVHERLKRMGIDTSQNLFTKEDEEYLAERYVPYRDAGALQVLADEMGRTKQFICRKAGALGLTDKNCKRRYLRVWEDMPREAVQGIWDGFKRQRLGVTEFCRRRHYDIQHFIDCMRRNFPEEYEEVVAAKHPKTSKYRRGRDFEYAVMKDMQGKGYLAVRSPASKSPADIYCFAKGSLVFIQCKLGGLIGVGEWNELYDYATSVGALPIMAEKVPGGIAYHLIEEKKDGTRRRQPMSDWQPPAANEEGESHVCRS